MIQTIRSSFEKMYKKPLYRFFLLLFGILSLPIVWVEYLKNKKNNPYDRIKNEILDRLDQEGVREEIYQESKELLENKLSFFNKTLSRQEFDKQVDENTKKKLMERVDDELIDLSKKQSLREATFANTFSDLFDNKAFLLYSAILSLPMYLLILIFSNPYAKYIFERLAMMIFVIFGVTWLVFTILYISPMDPAQNILGPTATADQIRQFNAMNGLDQPYLIQLLNTFKNLVTFNMGNSYLGNEEVVTAIMRKFPVTLQLTFTSLFVAILIAIPAGIISAIKQYSTFDHVFMLLALIGLSIPNFWLGLILILNFSIKLNWLPATFIVGNWKTLIMPSIVLGTSLAATVARMTRSSMLEVKNMDYIVTARAKGLSEKKVVMRHILGNAMIPIVTVIGLQFGAMLGGAAVTEKVFNINGVGSFIVDKQFIPDIPIVLAGVVYVAVIISLANLVVDIMYSFLDPRIKSKMKAY